MGLEIERKFLVRGDGWRAGVTTATRLVQGYLVAGPGLTVRLRIAGADAWLTIKGATTGIARAEYEYPVPVADAGAMLATLAVGTVLEKTRHRVPVAGPPGAAARTPAADQSAHLVWEIDVFAGANAGLVLAELELPAVDTPFPRPDWLGEEVSGDPRYFNAALAQRPFGRW